MHRGNHDTMEWNHRIDAAQSATCATDAAIANMPLIYPFLVNDPGEGAQAKRRAHATIIDHLIPPMARSESYGDIAKDRKSTRLNSSHVAISYAVFCLIKKIHNRTLLTS